MPIMSKLSGSGSEPSEAGGMPSGASGMPEMPMGGGMGTDDGPGIEEVD